MMKTDYKKLIKFEYFGAAVILFLFFVFDLYPNVTDVVILKRKIHLARVAVRSISDAEKKKELDKLQRQLETTGEDFSVVQKSVALLHEKMADENNIALITLRVEEIASKVEMELSYIRPGDPKIMKGFELIPISIGSEGDYSKILGFLSEIENMMTLTRVSLLNKTADPEKLSLEVTLGVVLKAEPTGEENG